MIFHAAPQTLRRIAGALAEAYPEATPERDLAALFGVVDLCCVLGFLPARWRGRPSTGLGVDALLEELLDAAREVDNEGWSCAPGARTLAYYVLKLDDAICERHEQPKEWLQGYVTLNTFVVDCGRCGGSYVAAVDVEWRCPECGSRAVAMAAGR